MAGDHLLNTPLCQRCRAPITPGARYCDNCGAPLFEENTDQEVREESISNFDRITRELGLIWTWVLRGRPGLKQTDGKEAWKLLKRARKLGFDSILQRFKEDSKWQGGMIQDRGWDPEGTPLVKQMPPL